MEDLLSNSYKDMNFKEKEILKILQKTGAILKGHFLLTSGTHSDGYIQCARILQYPSYAKKVLELIAEKVKHLDMEIVVGPALGE